MVDSISVHPKHNTLTIQNTLFFVYSHGTLKTTNYILDHLGNFSKFRKIETM